MPTPSHAASFERYRAAVFRTNCRQNRLSAPPKHAIVLWASACLNGMNFTFIISRRSLSLSFQANTQSDAAIKEKVFSALALAVKEIQQEKAIILNALVRMRMRYVFGECL